MYFEMASGRIQKGPNICGCLPQKKRHRDGKIAYIIVASSKFQPTEGCPWQPFVAET